MPKKKPFIYLQHLLALFEGEQFDIWGQTFSIIMHLAELIYGRQPAFALKPPNASTTFRPVTKAPPSSQGAEKARL